MAKTNVVRGNPDQVDERDAPVIGDAVSILVGSKYANNVVARFFDRTRWLDTHDDVSGLSALQRSVT